MQTWGCWSKTLVTLEHLCMFFSFANSADIERIDWYISIECSIFYQSYSVFLFEISCYIQGVQLCMAVSFWNLVKHDLPSEGVYSSLHWTNHFLQGTRKTLPCLSGHVVLLVKCIFMLLFAVILTSSVSDPFHFDMDPDPNPAPIFDFCGNFPWFSLIFCYHDPDQDPFHWSGSGTGWPKWNGSGSETLHTSVKPGS